MKTFFKLLLTLIIWILVLAISAVTAVYLNYAIEDGLFWGIAIIVGFYVARLTLWLIRRLRRQTELAVILGKKVTRGLLQRISILWQDKDNLSGFEQHLREVIHFLDQQGKTQSLDALHDLPFILHISSTPAVWLQEQPGNRPFLHTALFNEHPFIKWHVLNHQIIIEVNPDLLPKGDVLPESAIELISAFQKLKRQVTFDGIIITTHQAELEQLDTVRNYRSMLELIRIQGLVDAPVTLIYDRIGEQAGLAKWLNCLDASEQRSALGFNNLYAEPLQHSLNTLFNSILNHIEHINYEQTLAHGIDETLLDAAKELKRHHQLSLTALTELLAANSLQSAPRLMGFYLTGHAKETHYFAAPLVNSSLFNQLPSLSLDDKSSLKRSVKIKDAAMATTCIIIITLVANHDKAALIELKQQADAVERSLKALDIATLEQLQVLVTNAQQTHLFAWPGLHEKLRVNNLLAARDKVFEQQFLPSIDRLSPQQLSNTNELEPNERVALLEHVMTRLDFIESVDSGILIDQLTTSDIELFPVELYTDIDPATLTKFGTLYVQYIRGLIQSGQDEKLRQLKSRYQDTLKNLYFVSEQQEWLVDWANSELRAATVSYQDYYRFLPTPTSHNRIPAAYTLSGASLINGITQTVSNYLPESERSTIDNINTTFYLTYEQDYLNHWQQFLTGFSHVIGSESLSVQQDTVFDLNGTNNPFFNVLNDAELNLSALEFISEPPEWVELIFYYQDMLAFGQDEVQSNPKKNKVLTNLGLKFIAATGPIGKAIAGSGKSALKTKKKLDKASGPGPGPSERELNLQQAATLLDTYKDNLAQLVFELDSPEFAINNIAPWFASNGNARSTDFPFLAAQANLTQLQRIIGLPRRQTDAFWSLLKGPLDLIQRQLNEQAACGLNEKWQQNLYIDATTLIANQQSTSVFEAGGLVDQFVQQHLASFIQRRTSGVYQAKTVDGTVIPFDEQLFEFLGALANHQPNISETTLEASLTMLPSRVNQNALLFIEETKVTLTCDEGKQTFVNRNFPVTHSVQWYPSCDRIDVAFAIGNRVLNKSFEGDAFRQFMAKLSDGHLIFNADEFPQHFYALNEFGVKTLRLNLSLSPYQTILERLQREAPSLPLNITECSI